jgi:PAS domain-containing protein
MTACWSTPVINAHGVFYGTFETYYYPSKKPTNESIRLLHRAAILIALALDLQNEHQRRLAINDKHDSFFKHHPDGCFELDFEGKFVSVNLASLQLSGFPEEKFEEYIIATGYILNINQLQSLLLIRHSKERPSILKYKPTKMRTVKLTGSI